MADAKKCDRCGKYTDDIESMIYFRMSGKTMDNYYAEICEQCCEEILHYALKGENDK